LDWIAAGQTILIQEGIVALRLSRLTEMLKVSTGSFYHHFKDMDEFCTALADHFPTAQVQALLDQLSEMGDSPVERMRLLAAQSVKSKLFQLDAAMRVWAATDQRAAGAIVQSEHRVANFLRNEFIALGFDRQAATLRSRLLLSASIARLVSLSPADQRSYHKLTLELLIHKAD
jgi:AcrR family transcriptional regulator